MKGVATNDPKTNGCPPPPPPPHATGKIKLRGAKVIIPGELEFQKGKALLVTGPKTDKLIKELNTFFTENTQISRLEVQGHTDSDGSVDANNKLSQDRADAIKAELVKAGVSSDRIATKGYGSSMPYMVKGKPTPNDTAAHKAMNRRVEFVVLQLNNQDWAAPPEDAAPPAPATPAPKK